MIILINNNNLKNNLHKSNSSKPTSINSSFVKKIEFLRNINVFVNWLIIISLPKEKQDKSIYESLKFYYKFKAKFSTLQLILGVSREKKNWIKINTGPYAPWRRWDMWTNVRHFAPKWIQFRLSDCEMASLLSQFPFPLLRNQGFLGRHSLVQVWERKLWGRNLRSCDPETVWSEEVGQVVLRLQMLTM